MRHGWKAFAAAVFLVLVSGEPSAWADNGEQILDLLLKKKVISQEEYDQIKKEAKEPAAAPTQTPEPPEGKLAPIGSYKDMETRRAGIENLRKEGYRNVWTSLDTLLKHSERVSVGVTALKVQYRADNTDLKPGTASDPATGFAGTVPTRDENGFRITRAEFYITGRMMPWATYYAEADFSRQSEIVMNNARMDFYTKDMPYVNGLYPYLSEIRVGQFGPPFGIEAPASQGLIDFINRAYYSDLSVSSVFLRPGDPTLNPFGKVNANGFVQKFDVGIYFIHKAPQLPMAPVLEWAVINGAARNFNDTNADKDLMGRLVLTPTEGMKLHFAGYTGTNFYTGAASGPLQTNTDVKKFRQGVMYTYIPPGFPRVKLQAEYVEGNDNGFRRRSWYQYILYRPFSWLPNFEPEYRYEQFTIDTNRPHNTLDRHTFGFNYYFHTNVKLTVNYEIKHDQNGGGDTNPNNKNFFATEIQFRY